VRSLKSPRHEEAGFLSASINYICCNPFRCVIYAALDPPGSCRRALLGRHATASQQRFRSSHSHPPRRRCRRQRAGFAAEVSLLKNGGKDSHDEQRERQETRTNAHPFDCHSDARGGPQMHCCCFGASSPSGSRERDYRVVSGIEWGLLLVFNWCIRFPSAGERRQTGKYLFAPNVAFTISPDAFGGGEHLTGSVYFCSDRWCDSSFMELIFLYFFGCDFFKNCARFNRVCDFALHAHCGLAHHLHAAS
jgi:hypothetical protein